MTQIFLDTNVLVYLVDDKEPRKQELARQLYKRCSAENEIVLSFQVLNEFFAVVTRKFAVKIDVSSAVGLVEGFARNAIVPLDLNLTYAAMALAQRYELNFWDALTVESALSGGAEVLYTEDLNHGQIIDGLRIENPFRVVN